MVPFSFPVSRNNSVEALDSFNEATSCRNYLRARQWRVSGISFIDSTPIIVCHAKRAHSHKLFEEEAKWGKNSVGWFYGFKLHLIINDEGELLAVKLTLANVDGRHLIKRYINRSTISNHRIIDLHDGYTLRLPLLLYSILKTIGGITYR